MNKSDKRGMGSYKKRVSGYTGSATTIYYKR